MGTRMVGHPDIEPASKVTADEGSEALLVAPPLLEQLFSEGGITRRLFQQSCHLQGRLQLVPGPLWHLLG